MKALVYFSWIGVLLTGCLAQTESNNALKTGSWRATIEIQGQALPFNLEVFKDSVDNNPDGYRAYLRNASERILLDQIAVKGDSVDIVLHIFDANIKARINGNRLEGQFIKNYEKDYRLPFQAFYGEAFRFNKLNGQNDIPDFSGKYAVNFVHERDTTPAIAVFEQFADSITGTFLTPTGDYRYLEGNVTDGKLQLSTFDGNHAYLFRAVKRADGKLEGEFYSGKTWKESWTAEKNENPPLPDAEKLTYLKDGYDRIAFSFPDVAGKKVQLTDDTYKNKVVVLQLLGTWCPNCMDETKFLAPWYEQNKHRDVKIIGLAYERKDDFAYASDRVRKMVAKLNVGYEILIAGVNDKDKAGETLPMLNKVVAFPTTIFIGRDGKVKKIHTGFTGPGTGRYYDQFIEHFNETVNELLGENQTSFKQP